MRSSVLFAAPLVAAVYGQETFSPVVVSVISGSATVRSTFTFSNPNTAFLTETNSFGVITGQPTAAAAETDQPAVVTSQPAVATIPAGLTAPPVVATIPAGLPTGINTVPIVVGSSPTSFLVSVGSSTTDVVGGGAVPTGASLTTGPSAGLSTGTAGANSGSAASSGGASGTSSASASASSGAANSLNVASAGVFGLGALFAAFL